MLTYYINRADTTKPDGSPLVTSQGKPFKKLELKADSDQYPKKNVIIWSDHPEYNNAVAGQSITCELLEKDSGTPNPNAPGKNYINRSVAMPGQQPAQATGLTQEYIDRKFAALQGDLKIIADHLRVEAPKPTIGNTNLEYPDISADDSPF